MTFFYRSNIGSCVFGGIGEGSNAVVILDHFSEIILDFLEGLRWSDATVDGSEIRRSPVDMENLPFFAGFYLSQVVVWDF